MSGGDSSVNFSSTLIHTSNPVSKTDRNISVGIATIVGLGGLLALGIGLAAHYKQSVFSDLSKTNTISLIAGGSAVAALSLGSGTLAMRQYSKAVDWKSTAARQSQQAAQQQLQESSQLQERTERCAKAQGNAALLQVTQLRTLVKAVFPQYTPPEAHISEEMTAKLQELDAWYPNSEYFIVGDIGSTGCSIYLLQKVQGKMIVRAKIPDDDIGRCIDGTIIDKDGKEREGIREGIRRAKVAGRLAEDSRVPTFIGATGGLRKKELDAQESQFKADLEKFATESEGQVKFKIESQKEEGALAQISLQSVGGFGQLLTAGGQSTQGHPQVYTEQVELFREERAAKYYDSIAAKGKGPKAAISAAKADALQMFTLEPSKMVVVAEGTIPVGGSLAAGIASLYRDSGLRRGVASDWEMGRFGMPLEEVIQSLEASIPDAVGEKLGAPTMALGTLLAWREKYGPNFEVRCYKEPDPNHGNIKPTPHLGIGEYFFSSIQKKQQPQRKVEANETKTPPIKLE